MPGRGIHFAIEDRHLGVLRAGSGPDELFDLVGVIEEELFQSSFDAETDKAWGLIHQTLVGANPCADVLEADGPAPLAYAVMGEESLCDSEWFMVTLTSAAQVPAVNGALQAISEAEFEARLRSLLATHDCPGITEVDVKYASHWFENMKRVFAAASDHGRHVIFEVDY